MQFTANLLKDGRVLVGGVFEDGDAERCKYSETRQQLMLQGLEYLTTKTPWTITNIYKVEPNITPYALQMFVDCDIEGVQRFVTASDTRVNSAARMGYDIHFTHDGKDIFINSKNLNEEKIEKLNKLGYGVFVCDNGVIVYDIHDVLKIADKRFGVPTLVVRDINIGTVVVATVPQLVFETSDRKLLLNLSNGVLEHLLSICECEFQSIKFDQVYLAESGKCVFRYCSVKQLFLNGAVINKSTFITCRLKEVVVRGGNELSNLEYIKCEHVRLGSRILSDDEICQCVGYSVFAHLRGLNVVWYGSTAFLCGKKYSLNSQLLSQLALGKSGRVLRISYVVRSTLSDIFLSELSDFLKLHRDITDDDVNDFFRGADVKILEV